MLWYLVIPPVIVVISLGVLLWVLSRGAGSEEVSRNLSLAKAEAMSGSHSRSLSRKAFFLKLVEKMASRFKTSTLRAHNFFQHSLERVRKRRSEIDAIRRHIGDETPVVTREDPEGEVPKRFGFRRGKKEGAVEAEDTGRISSETTAVETKFPTSPDRTPRPLSDRFRRPLKKDIPDDSAVPEPEVAPILRREVMKPDPRARKAEKDPHEVALLSRIVENPRDISAYEELGDWYFEEESMEDAKECYRQALKLHPTNRAIKIKIRKLERFFEGRSA